MTGAGRRMDAKRRLGRIWQRVLLIVIALIIGVSLYSANARKLVGDPMPMPLGVGMSVVLSGSMEPVLHVDDLVIIKEQDSYEVGDVVVYRDGSSLTIHRIIDLDGDTVITQGDANNVHDEPFTADKIKGKMVKVIHGAGRFVDTVRSPVCIGIVLAAAIGLFALSCRKEKSADDAKLDAIREELARLKEELEEENGNE